jgi:hypothetical protein
MLRYEEKAMPKKQFGLTQVRLPYRVAQKNGATSRPKDLTDSWKSCSESDRLTRIYCFHQQQIVVLQADARISTESQPGVHVQ